MKHDIVYILKNNIDSDEIRYSIRSVVENFPYRKIWFYGGCPDGITPDEYVHLEQKGETKWQKSTWTLAQVCQNDDITEDFWLFNDDFYVLKRVRSEKPYIRGTLQRRVKDIEAKQNGMTTAYSRQLRRTMHVLKINGYKQNDYALHVPMLINRAKALEVINKFPDCPMFRSLYGNYWDIGGEIIKDVKIQGSGEVPEDAKFLSSDDKSFLKYQVGDFLRSRFTEPTKYESGA